MIGPEALERDKNVWVACIDDAHTPCVAKDASPRRIRVPRSLWTAPTIKGVHHDSSCCEVIGWLTVLPTTIEFNGNERWRPYRRWRWRRRRRRKWWAEGRILRERRQVQHATL